LSGIEDWSTTMDMIADENKQLNPLMIEDAGWCFCKKEKVYYGPKDKQNK